MPFMPFSILGIWMRGLLSLAILAGGLYLLSRWYQTSHVVERIPPVAAGADADRDGRPEAAAPGRRVFRFSPGANEQTAYLAAGIALLAWASVGTLIGRLPSLLKGGGRRPIEDDPKPDRTGERQEIARPDGSILRVECYGPADAPPIVFTHGWGANSTEWYYAKKYLAGKFRLIVWDEPGLGLSKKPDNNDYRLEKMAADLDAVLSLAGGRPAVLVGHSIGGMIILTLCKAFPARLTGRVAGLVLAHTTYKNPVRTTHMAALYTALERPLIIPMLHLTIALWPLVWLMNWMSYLNGSAHRSTHKGSFGGTETLGQLDFCTRFMAHARPDILARGMFGMLAYDATDALAAITLPTLVVTGDQDTTTPPEAGRFIATHIPGATEETLAPAKHMGLIEHHERFTGALERFAASCQTEVGGRPVLA